MNSAKIIRLNHIFAPDRRSVIVAMDHGLPGMGPLGKLTHPGDLIQQIKSGGADAILTTPGIASHFAEYIGRLGLIIRLDGASTTLGQGFGEMRLIASVEDALRLGADAVAVMGFCGTDDETSSLETLGKVATECRQLGVPLMAEMLPLGFQGKPTVQQIALAARIGAELGADIIKTKYVGTSEEYHEVTNMCFAPVVILGGSARSSDEMIAEVKDAIHAGSAGVAIGRNVWQAEDVTAQTRSIVQTVHAER